MKISPHKLGYSGFFAQLDPKILEQQLLTFLSRKAQYFSFGTHAKHESRIRCLWRITTENEDIEPSATGEEEGANFSHQLAACRWVFAQIKFEHALVMKGKPPFNLSEVYRGEFLELKIDNEIGNIDAECRLRDLELSRRFLSDLLTNLQLSEQPMKHSRDVPEWLETRLLCDSLHRCNICKNEDVHIHHIIPMEAQGETVEDNLIVLCMACHGRAHTKRQLTKNLKPKHLREYKKRHLEWVKSLAKAPLVNES